MLTTAAFPAPAQLPAELLALFSVLPGAHLLLSPALVVEAVSETYLATTQASRTDLLGQPLAAVATGIGAQYATACQGLLAQVPAAGQPFGRAASSAGSGRWQLSHAPVLDARGQVQHVLHTAFDQAAYPQAAAQRPARNTTKRAAKVQRQQAQLLNEQLTAANAALSHTNQALRARNEALEATNHRLARINEDLDSVVYTASHDLKGPIDNLQGLLQALGEELPAQCQAAPVAHILELMHASAVRFRRTLGRLVATAHWPADPAPGPSANLADLVRDVLLDLALPIAEAGAQLTVDVADCPDPALAEKNLYSVVYNLVSNAIKYRQPGRVPQVRVRCYTETNNWVLLVQDNGLGLDLASGQPLFGLFQRFHAHTEGSGVGLYLVKRIVEHAGGHVEVASQLGVGSTFTVYLKRS